MTIPTAYRTSLLVGFAQIIADAGFGTWLNGVGNYAAGDTGIEIIAKPTDPSKCITLSPYGVRADARLSDVVTGMQVWIRGTTDPRSVLDLDDAIFGLINGMHDTEVGGIPMQLCWWASSAPMPPDQNDRFQHSTNYYIRTAWPTTYRLDD